MAASPDDDAVFRALADPGRRELLDRLRARDGLTLRELCEGLGMARQSVSKHLAVLEAAGLVTTERRGREKLHHLNAAPIDALGDRWISRYSRPRVRALAELKTALEGGAVDAFTYTTYIRTTPERLWEALTSPAFTERYWGVRFTSSWEAGAAMAWIENGVEITDPGQRVVEADPPRRLVYTWHAFTPEWAAGHGFSGELLAALQADSRSTVSFDIAPAGEAVRLTVVHDAAGTTRGMIEEGWPAIVASLKTLLETGQALPV